MQDTLTISNNTNPIIVSIQYSCGTLEPIASFTDEGTYAACLPALLVEAHKHRGTIHESIQIEEPIIKIKLIHGVEIDDISFTPSGYERYYTPSIASESYYECFINDAGTTIHRVLASRQLCYPFTDEGKQAAIKHTKILLGYFK